MTRTVKGLWEKCGFFATRVGSGEWFSYFLLRRAAPPHFPLPPARGVQLKLVASFFMLSENAPMGKHEKLISRLKNRPKDFTFQELTTLLSGFSYVLNQSGSGSRVRFEHELCAPVLMHKPHPSPALRTYQIDAVLDILKQEGLL